LKWRSEPGCKNKENPGFPAWVLFAVAAYFVATGGGAVGVVATIPPPHELHEPHELQLLQQLLQVLQQVWQQGSQQLFFFLRRPASAESGVRATQAQATTATIQILRSIRLPP
jgi:hypothetical protein